MSQRSYRLHELDPSGGVTPLVESNLSLLLYRFEA